MSKLARMLMALTGFNETDFYKIVRTAPRRYKSYTIPKKSGGVREIAQPARELKVLQRALMEVLLADLPVHEAAKAYRLDHSIRDNAKLHAGDTPILKMDFRNFFPSIRSSDWWAYCGEHLRLESDDIQISTSIMFRLKKKEIIPKLTIGAPTSPMLSNILLLRFDESIFAEAKRRGINYSRYADDLTFSGQRIGMLKDMEDVVKRAVANIKSPKLRINHDKTTYVTTAYRRTVTGVVLTNQGDLSIGRERKRLLRAKIYRASRGMLTDVEMQQLAGELSFTNVVEPRQIEIWRQKFGDELIAMIQRSVHIEKS